MTIRCAHFSDLHYAGATLAQVERCFSFAVDEAIRRGVDLAIVSGDATDHALDAHAPAFAALARNVRRLTDHCPVLMLQGTFSHEPPGMLAVLGMLGGRFPVHVSDRIEQLVLMPGGRWIASTGWSFESVPADAVALLSCVPTINKALVAAMAGTGHAAGAMGEHIAILLRGFAPVNEQARACGIPTIGVSHGTVNGCLSEHGVPMAGLDHEFTSGALFGAGATAFMLGHIHKHQAWRDGGRAIAYPGSIARLHHGEEGDKGFLLWEVGADRAQFALVPTPARRTVDIAFDGPPDLAALRRAAAGGALDGVWVRLRWSVPEEDRIEVDRAEIGRILAGAAGVKLEGRVIAVLRARAAGISREATVDAQVRRWADVVAASAAPLLACLDASRRAEPEEIAVAIVDGMAATSPGGGSRPGT